MRFASIWGFKKFRAKKREVFQIYVTYIYTKRIFNRTDCTINMLSNLNTIIYQYIGSWWGMRWAGHVARMGEERGVYRVLVGNEMGWACGTYG